MKMSEKHLRLFANFYSADEQNSSLLSNYILMSALKKIFLRIAKAAAT